MYQGVFKLLDIDSAFCRLYYPDIDQAISPNEEIPLIDINYSKREPGKIPPKVAKELGVSIEYRSMYGDSYNAEYTPLTIPAG